MKDPYASLRLPDFRKYIAARFFITIAIQIQAVVVSWQIYDRTGDPLSLGLIGLAEALPAISVALFAGHISDTRNRKHVITASLFVLMLCSLALLVFTRDSLLSIYGTLPLYSVIFISGIARGFLGPSAFAFMAQIVPRNLYSNSATWNSTTWQTGAVTGPALGGLLYGFYGITISYAVDMFFVGVSLFFLLLVPSRPLPPRKRQEPFMESLRSGLQFVFKNQIMVGAMSLDLFAVLFGGAVALLPIFADEILKVGPQGLGFLRSAPSFGAVIMAMILAHHPPHRNSGKNLLFSVAGFGISIILFALSTNYYLSLLFLALAGMFDNVSVVIRSTIMQLLTPDEMRGRVSSINSIFIGSSNEIGAFESGIAARLLGAVPSVIFGGLMTLLVVALSAIFTPKLRDLHLQVYHDK